MFSARTFCLLSILAITCAASTAFAAGVGQEKPAISADELVARAVDVQLKDPGGAHHFMYRLHRLSAERNETREVVETNDGSLTRVLMIAGKPLTEDQQKAEAARLDRYVSEPGLWQQRRKKQKDDEDRSNRLLAALPKAFLYTYDGTDPGPNGDEWTRLSFRPNPGYVAPARELRVFEGMEGKMWVDAQANRLVRMDAKLTRDVDFGWGILGKLYAGGSFEIEQRDIGDGRWEVVHTKLNFDGKELMFKSLHIKEDETLSDFHPVPEKLSLAEGIHMLEQYNPGQDSAVAERNAMPGGGTPPRR